MAQLDEFVQASSRFLFGSFAATHDQLAKSREKTATAIAQYHQATSQKLAQTFQVVTAPVLKLTKGLQIASESLFSYLFEDTPTRISEVTIEEVGQDYAVVSWQTNHFTKNNKVNYGKDLSYGEEAWSQDYERKHVVTIKNLEKGTHYFFEVMSQNDTYIYDAYYSFETKSGEE